MTTLGKRPKRVQSVRPKHSVRATRRQSSGSGRGRQEVTVPLWLWKLVAAAWHEAYTTPLPEPARIRELEAQLSKRKGTKRLQDIRKER